MAGASRRSLLGMPLARLVAAHGEQRLVNLRRPFSSLRGEELHAFGAPIARSLAALRGQRLGEAAAPELDAIEQHAARLDALAMRLCEASAEPAAQS